MSPWVRIDEHALNHVKILRLSHGAFRLWVEGLAHCQKHLTDGAISGASLREFRYLTRKALAELTASVDRMEPLWLQVDVGYQVHDYLTWNDSRSKVLRERAKAKARFDKFKNGVANGVANGDATVYHIHTTEDPKIKSTAAPRRSVENSPGTFGLYAKIAAEARDFSIRQDGDDSISNIAAIFKSLCATRKLTYDSQLAAKAIEAVMVAAHG